MLTPTHAADMKAALPAIDAHLADVASGTAGFNIVNLLPILLPLGIAGLQALQALPFVRNNPLLSQAVALAIATLEGLTPTPTPPAGA